MSNYGNYQHVGGDARRAHLALVVGGGGSSIGAAGSTAATRSASAAIGSDPVLRLAPVDRAPRVATAYAAASTAEAPRTRHDAGVRAAALSHPTFEEALLPMVLASGVSKAAAAGVAEAIRRNPALAAQAERAFHQARTSAG